MIGRKKPGLKAGDKGGYNWDDPEYVILEAGVTDEMCEVGLVLGSYVKKSAAEVAALRWKNRKTIMCHEQLMKLAVYGACFVNCINGVDMFWTETWIPGTMEMIVNNLDTVKQYPIVGYAMEAYGRVRGPMSSGSFPVGVGLMRVIPIQSAIDGESRKASYEEISTYLEENDIFTVSPCSCRTDREVMGEGCGHLKEDMCIQMGHAAEYYIRTGRGRQITREEAYEILKRAEENGLMHEIPNTDGSGKTHAICNCCGCGCLSLRTAAMFKNVDMVRSNYVSEVDAEKVRRLRAMRGKLPSQRAQARPEALLENNGCAGHHDDRSPRGTRTGRRTNGTRSTASTARTWSTAAPRPARRTAPRTSAFRVMSSSRPRGNTARRWSSLKLENPLPAVCGRICNRRCEQACMRGEIDSPIAIDEIKKFIAAQELTAERSVCAKEAA